MIDKQAYNNTFQMDGQRLEAGKDRAFMGGCSKGARF